MTNLETNDRIISTGNGVRLAVAQTGTGTAPLKALYLHGLLTDGSFWHPLITELTPRLGNRVDHLAVDARGHGRSQWPSRTARNGVDALADDLAALVDAVDGPLILVAHSLGGFVAQEYAHRHPASFAARIRSVVGFAICAELPEWPALQPFRRLARPIRPLRHGRLDAVNAAAHTLMQTRMRALAGRAKPGRAQLVPSIHPVDPRVTADFCTTVETYHLDEQAARTLSGCPIRLISGEYDTVVPPEQTRRFGDLVGTDHFTLVRNAGHSLPWSQPATAGDHVQAAVNELTAGTVTIAVAGQGS